MTPEELEQLLRDQPLRQPSSLLDERIRQTLGKSAAKPRELFGAELPRTQLRWRNWLSAGALLAACVAIAFSLSRVTTPPTHDGTVAVAPADPIAPPIATNPVAPQAPVAASASAATEPYSTQEESSEMIPGEVVMTSDRRAVRPVRRHTVRTTRYYDPQKNVRMEWTEPTDEIVIMPVESD